VGEARESPGSRLRPAVVSKLAPKNLRREKEALMKVLGLVDEFNFKLPENSGLSKFLIFKLIRGLFTCQGDIFWFEKGRICFFFPNCHR
jgi:hypothetical protein